MRQMRFVVWLLVSAHRRSKTSSPCGLGLNQMKLFWYDVCLCSHYVHIDVGVMFMFVIVVFF